MIVQPIVTYDIAKPRVIALRQTLHLRSRMYRKSNQQDLRDDEFREVATISNMRNIVDYRISTKSADDLPYANAKIIVRVFKKSSLPILLKSHQFN
jgi:hypothetical protein